MHHDYRGSTQRNGAILLMCYIIFARYGTTFINYSSYLVIICLTHRKFNSVQLPKNIEMSDAVII